MRPVPVIAIIGRANVGKSTLFNRLVGHRRAIVHDQPGVTRDPIYASISLSQKPVWLVDTGGLALDPANVFSEQVRKHVKRTVDEADLLILVFDGKEGLTGFDQDLVTEIRKKNKPVIGVVNKMDSKKAQAFKEEFYQLGMDPLLSISAEHNLGMKDLREAMESQLAFKLTQVGHESFKDENQVHVAFIGRPNVGKSSLVNVLLDEPRLMVSQEPGTTRDVIDTPLKLGSHKFLVLDTAGLRRKTKVSDPVEFFSIFRTLRAIDRADVAILVLDAQDSITTQDQKIASGIIDKGTGLLLAVNKWDLKKDGSHIRRRFRDDVYALAPFLRFSELRFVSAKKRLGVPGLLKAAHRIWKNAQREFPKADLKVFFERTFHAYPPPGKVGAKLRLWEVSQDPEDHLTFFVWCNDPRFVPKAYAKHWENALVQELDLKGIPLRVVFRRKKSTARRRQVRQKA